MTTHAGILRRLQVRAANLSIFSRIAIGNSIIIIIGAIGGTIITVIVTERGAELISIMLFALAGISLSVFLNLYIIRAALTPLLKLRHAVEGFNSGEAMDVNISLRNPDPDTIQLAASLSSLIQRLEASNHQLRAISKRASQAQEQERTRIARSLHDETGQALLTLMLNLERLEAELDPEETIVKEKLITSRKLAADNLDGLRSIIYDLRPAILDDLGLIPAIRWYARTNLEEAGIRVDIRANDAGLPLQPETRTILFRIAQEAVNNIVRHSQASMAVIEMGGQNGDIFLRVKDDGVGFKVAGDQGEAIRMHQWGLVGIQERVALAGGRLIINSNPGNGTLLEVLLPSIKTSEEMDG